jgi:hypothetical protein
MPNGDRIITNSFKTVGDCPKFAQSAEQIGTVPLPQTVLKLVLETASPIAFMTHRVSCDQFCVRARLVCIARNSHVDSGHDSGIGSGSPARRRSRAIAAAARHARASRRDRSSNDGGNWSSDSAALMAAIDLFSRVTSSRIKLFGCCSGRHAAASMYLWHK